MAVLTLSTERLVVMLPCEDQAAAMLDFAERNRQHLKPWNPPEPEGLYTLAHWQDVVARSAAAFNAGSAANRYVFEGQKLHRISANYRPENVRSGRLLAKLGFRIEGFAKSYLFIDGAWRDHILTSLLASQYGVALKI